MKTKHKEGYTHDEILQLLKESPEIDPDTFFHNLGVNTCIMRDGELITYHCDVDFAIRCTRENRTLWHELD